MRVVALLLLIANLVFFAWQYPQQRLIKDGSTGTETAVASAADDADAQSLMMLKELPPAVAEKIVTVNLDKPAPATRVPAKKKEAQPPVCWSLGPFADGRQADQGLTLLTAQGIKGRVLERKASAMVGYRVQLPGQGSKEAAQRTIQEIRARGVKDIAMRASGGRFYVSLGFFSKKTSAQKRTQAVQKLGYKPLTEKVYREKSGYWLDLYDNTDPSGLDKVWGKLLGAYPKVGRDKIKCP